MRKIKVEKKSALLAFLFEALSDTKKTKVRDYLKAGCVWVNERCITQFDHELRPGDLLEIRSEQKSIGKVQPLYGVKIIYEDLSIIVAEKPAGLLTISTDKVRERTTFFAVNDYVNRVESARIKRERGFLDKKLGKKQIFIVHRLDRDTSGLILFAKTEDVKFNLQDRWELVTKHYYAITEGAPKKNAGTINSYLYENKILRIYSGPSSDSGKFSITHYEVIQRNGDRTLLKIRLETGRKHQIRVHMSDLGCPILGDRDYGAKTNPIGRLALHACALSFPHPKTGKMMNFESVLPDELQKTLEN